MCQCPYCLEDLVLGDKHLVTCAEVKGYWDEAQQRYRTVAEFEEMARWWDNFDAQPKRD